MATDQTPSRFDPADRERVRALIAAALAGQEYSVIEMASDLEHALNALDRQDAALQQVASLLGGGKIRWEPNYPEVDRAVLIATEKAPERECGEVSDDGSGRVCRRICRPGRDYHGGGHWFADPALDGNEVRHSTARWIVTGKQPGEAGTP